MRLTATAFWCTIDKETGMANYELFRQRLQAQREEWQRQQRELERQQVELGENAPPELREENERLCAMLDDCDSKLREMDEVGEERWNSSVGDSLESAWESILEALGMDQEDEE
jgi:hypothetical protein